MIPLEYTEAEVLEGAHARDILNSVACQVKLSITLSEHSTVPGISENDTIFVTGLDETHIHNITHIQDPVSGKYIPIDWDKE